MRSRYSAYATKQHSYILETYGKIQRSGLKMHELQSADNNTHWLKLEVLSFTEHKTTAQVEFRAYYRIDEQPHTAFFTLHELSDFCLEDNQWCYISGQIFNDSGQYKPNRKESCLCGSSKKYKKCCGV